MTKGKQYLLCLFLLSEMARQQQPRTLAQETMRPDNKGIIAGNLNRRRDMAKH